MIDENLAPACGLYCGACEHRENENQCTGCGKVQGKPFWTKHMGIEVCPLHGCCVDKRHLEHCGMCDNLPCELFNSFHDPALDEKEAKKAVLVRQKELLSRKKIGTQKWLKEREA